MIGPCITRPRQRAMVALTHALSLCALAAVLCAAVPSVVRAASPIATDDPGDYLSLVTALGAQSHWRLGELAGPAAIDIGPTANDGTYTGGLFAQPGVVNGDPDGSLHFTRLVDHAEISHSDDYLIDNGAVQIWFNVDAINLGDQGLFSKDASGYLTGGHFSFYVRNNGDVEARI